MGSGENDAKQLTTQDPAQQLRDLLARVDKAKTPAESDLAQLRKLGSHPALWRSVGNLMSQAQAHTLQALNLTASARELMQCGAEQLRTALGYSASTELEKLLIDAIVLCQIRLGYCEHEYTTVFQGEGPTLTRGLYWERKLTMTQKRYLKAIETLARVRRLIHSPNVQVNIATAGGQQVNVAR